MSEGKSEGKDKQAVLVIHGIGEQVPMSILRGFVGAVWESDESVHHEHGVDTVWSKPDTVSGSYELRRLTTGRNRAGVGTDFYELYWAHRMHGTDWGHVWAWARSLLVRNPLTLPGRLRLAWLVLVVLGLVVAFFALQAALPDESAWRVVPWPDWASAAASAFTALVAGPIMTRVVGDAARYLNASPPNVQRRQEIRHHGVDILNKLHDAGYERIIVVGHSLGAVIGYDVLNYAWAEYHDQRTDDQGSHKALDELEALAQAAGEGEAVDLAAWRAGQRRYAQELRELGCPWRVTDFVTLGAPLTHAEVLLAADRDDLEKRQTDRELPTCPPLLEKGTHFSYPLKNVHRKPHHGAVFAPTRWTNLYFPSRGLLRGDLIGGPLGPAFGPGVEDVPMHTEQRGGWLSHTLYWSRKKGDEQHIVELRKAVDLLDRDKPGAEKAGT